ncbi:MAG TPA: alpha/beta hydrolase fold domain-containing protein [Frankiaceae bacterium]|nr:alpha/beta hydrolase fold domain-containing protein [Frankiaceae bacterium]
MDSELEAVIAVLPPEFTDPASSFADPRVLRERLAVIAQATAQAGLAPVPDERVSRRDQSVPGAAGDPDVTVRVYMPEGGVQNGAVILHIHGGAFVIGHPLQDDVPCELLALATSLPIVSVDYRLAPEAIHPAQINDCFAVYRWLAAGSSGLDIDPEQIVVTGVSAGGALAAAVAQRARDEGGIQPIYQVLLYPVLDDRMTTPSMRKLLDTPLWNGRSSVHMWRHYLGPDAVNRDDTSPYAAPARATDLTGLAPAAITTAEFDPLRDEAIEYAQRLMQAGVPTELHVVAGAVHAFDGFALQIGLSRRIRESRYIAMNSVLSQTAKERAVTPGEPWLDPEIASILPFLPAAPEGATIQDARKELEAMLGVGAPAPGEENLAVTHRAIPGPDGAPDVPVIIYRPKSASGLLPAVVDFHGGAFIMGSAQMDHMANVRIAKEANAVVVSVDYRLAPEHPFPAGVEDCYAGLLWTHANATELGIDTSRVAITGGSAGGALAAAVALMARDRKGPAICFQALGIPVTDDRLETWSSRTFVATPMFNRPGAENMWVSYLGAGYEGRETSPYAAPNRATDLSGLPPAYVQTMELDPLRDEGIEYAKRLMEAGVSVELHSYPGTFHGSGLAMQAAVSRRSAKELTDVLAKVLNG